MNSASQSNIQIKVETKTEKSKKLRKKNAYFLGKRISGRSTSVGERRTTRIGRIGSPILLKKSRHRRNEMQLHLRKKNEKKEEGDVFGYRGDEEMEEP